RGRAGWVREGSRRRKPREPEEDTRAGSGRGDEGRRRPLIRISNGSPPEDLAVHGAARARVEDVDIVQLVSVRELRDDPPSKRRHERRNGGDLDEARPSGRG